MTAGLGTYLLAYDDSESARKALRRTIELVNPRDLVVLLWVIPSVKGSPGALPGLAPEGTAERASAVERLNAAVRQVHREGRQASALMLDGDVAQVICRTGDELDADLIILGHKGVSRIGPLTLGSVADRVAHLSNRRVLIVK
jgi:nucleotide-binding universal stress UspA family protein